MRGNQGFWKYVKGETQLQVSVTQFLSLKNIFFHHSPNEGKRSRFEQFLMKIMGVQSGFPDLEIFPTKPDNPPVYMELKYGTNVPTDQQRRWLGRLAFLGYRCYLVYTFDSANCIINELLDKWSQGSPLVPMRFVKLMSKDGFSHEKGEVLITVNDYLLAEKPLLKNWDVI